MKKTLMVIASVATLSLSSFGQGSFFMIYYDGVHGISAGSPSNPANHAGLALGSEYSAIAYLGAVGSPESSLTPLAATLISFDINGTTRAAGTIANGSGQFYGANAITTALPTGAAAIQIRAWYNNGQYNSYDAAAAAGVNVGKSPILSITLKSASDPTGQDLNAAGLQPFTVTSVPEPSSIVLAGLGAAALLIFRRRN